MKSKRGDRLDCERALSVEECVFFGFLPLSLPFSLLPSLPSFLSPFLPLTEETCTGLFTMEEEPVERGRV